MNLIEIYHYLDFFVAVFVVILEKFKAIVKLDPVGDHLFKTVVFGLENLFDRLGVAVVTGAPVKVDGIKGHMVYGRLFISFS